MHAFSTYVHLPPTSHQPCQALGCVYYRIDCLGFSYYSLVPCPTQPKTDSHFENTNDSFVCVWLSPWGETFLYVITYTLVVLFGSLFGQ